MNILKFNKFERVAGVFILVAILGALLTAFSAAIKQGWFEPKVFFLTQFPQGDGIHPGTTVLMAGLKAGAVEEVSLREDSSIEVSFYVLGKFSDKVREDSRTLLVRPFVLGDRTLEITVGREGVGPLKEHSVVPSEETMDIMSLMSGKNLGSYLSQMGEMVENVQGLLQAFLNKDRTESMVKIFDKLDPLLGNLNTMSLEVIKLSNQATDDQNLKKLMSNVVLMTKEMNKILPALNQKNPDLAEHLALMTKNLALMSRDIQVMGSTMKEVGPELPGAARRTIEAINEATILLKAMQKSFFFKSAVQEVRKEETEKKNRAPASEAR